MFVRSKTVKGKQYAYLVENVWKKGKVKQVVKKYVGRVYALPEPSSTPTLDIDFSLPQKKVFQLLIAKELLSRGFSQGRGEVYLLDDMKINLSKGKITALDKDIALFLNGRYLYGRLLRDLLDFFAPEDEDEQKGKKLAQAFSDAGISIDQEHFIELYKKIYVEKG